MRMSPRNARYTEIIRMKTDYHDTKGAWIIADGIHVTIGTRKNGAPPTGKVTLSRREMNALVDWYIRPQEMK